MFERYTEKARRTIFFARYEASQFGSPTIETEHLLLGLLREGHTLSARFFQPPTTLESLREQIRLSRPFQMKIPDSVDLPLSDECKRVLAYAAEEAAGLNHQFIGPEHLLLGLLRQQHSFAAELLSQHGVTDAAVRRDIQDNQPVQRDYHLESAPSALLSRIELALNVADLNASLAFYSALGFVQVGGTHPDGATVIANGNCRLALYHGHTAENLLSLRGVNVASLASRLETAGIKFEKPPFTAKDGSTTALLRDPDGNAIRLASNYSVPNPGKR